MPFGTVGIAGERRAEHAGGMSTGERAAKPRRLPRRPASSLSEHWTRIDGVDVFYREAPGPAGARTMMHVHGFGLSGRYLLPTAERLVHTFHTLVPDLPGFGRSGGSPRGLAVPDLAHAAVRFLDDRGVEKATLVGNSMGCPVILEFAHHYPDRIDRAVLVSPAGGAYNRPMTRAVLQLAKDGGREPMRMVKVAVPDYLRFGVASTVIMFDALTNYPSLERLLELTVPTLVVIGDRDPLMPDPERVRELVAETDDHVVIVRLEGAAHAINFSEPDELAYLIEQFMADRPIVQGASPAQRSYEIHRSRHLPAPGE